MKYVGPSDGSQQSGEKRFFAKYGGPSDGSLLSGGGIIIFHVIRRHFLAAAVDPAVSLSTTVLFRWKSFLDHVDHAMTRAPGRWTTVRPRKGRRSSGCPRGEEYEGSLVRLRCCRRRITGGVGEWRDGLASGGSSRGR